MSQIVAIVIVFMMSLSAFAKGDIEAGREKAKKCAACHGADGNSTNPAWPKLAGQHADYIALQIRNFQKGYRNNAQMAPMVKDLTEQDKADLAAYFSSQPIKPSKANPELLKDGAKIYRFGNTDTNVPACMACHGPRGNGNPASKYPSISGQHASYVETQLLAFKKGERENTVMQTVVSRMTSEEMKIVADFIQGLH